MATPAYVLEARDEWAATMTGAVPWFLYAVLFASTSVIVGVIVGHLVAPHDRPRHVLDARAPRHLPRRRRRRPDLRLARAATRRLPGRRMRSAAASVRFWGFRAPLGAWVCIWGAFAMLTSAPFDDWWHNAYGLDVKILSPPHMLLAAGIGAIQCGAMLMALAWQNRADRRSRAQPRPACICSAPDCCWCWSPRVATEYTPALGHAPVAVLPGSGGRVPVLARQRRAGVGLALAGDDRRRSSTRALMLLMLIVLPLFRARSRCSARSTSRSIASCRRTSRCCSSCRRWRSTSSMQRVGRRARDWRLSASSRSRSSSAFLAVQWPFADFLMTPWARNWFFGSDRMAYSVDPAFQAALVSR